MKSKFAVAVLIVSFASTVAFAQTAAQPAQTPPSTQAPASKTPATKTPAQTKTPPEAKPAPPAQTPAPEAAKPAQSPAPKPTSTTGRRPRAAVQTQVVARDVSGTPLEGVTLAIAGPQRAEATTDASGAASVSLPDGSYRFRFAHDGFVTLEKEVTIRNGRPGEVEVALNRAPPPPAPPVAPPAPEPAAPPVRPSGPPAYVSIPAYLEKNFIGRDPLKESVLGCMPDAVARLLQLRESVAQHSHADLDEVIYVVAGEGTVRIGTEAISATPGMLTTIPRGVAHAFERRGRNPLILLSTLAGAPPCPNASATQADSK